MRYKSRFVLASLAAGLIGSSALAQDSGRSDGETVNDLATPSFQRNTTIIPGEQGDNLGNHQATQQLNMNGNVIRNVGWASDRYSAASPDWVYWEFGNHHVLAGDGMWGGGNLSGNVTMSVDSSVVRTHGEQWINGTKRFNGDITANRMWSNAYYYHSDRRLKDNIHTISADDGMAIIRKIRPVDYTWKQGGRTAHGVIAQEIEEIYPEIVSTDKTGVKSVDYIQMLAPAIAALQQLDERVSALETE